MRSGPGPADPSSLLWMYHSHVDETSETYAGLAGALIVTRKGACVRAGIRRGRVHQPGSRGVNARCMRGRACVAVGAAGGVVVVVMVMGGAAVVVRAPGRGGRGA